VRDLARIRSNIRSFNAEVANDLRTSLELFVDDVVWSERSDFRELMLVDLVAAQWPVGQFLRRRSADRRPVSKSAASMPSGGPAC